MTKPSDDQQWLVFAFDLHKKGDFTMEWHDTDVSAYKAGDDYRKESARLGTNATVYVFKLEAKA